MRETIAYREKRISPKERRHIKESTLRQERLKDGVCLALCFFLPTVMMAAVWGSIGIAWGGVLTPLVYDMEVQYMPFFASLRYILSGKNSMFSWGTALGGNYYGLFLYYMASPLSWLTVLFDLKHLPDALYLLTLLKIGLCGLSFGIYIRFGLSGKRSGPANVVFSGCYALMSYNIMYNICLMWMDGVILLPLVLLGIEELLKGKRGLLYGGAIFSLFAVSYYISYMAGIFAAVYLLCRVLSMVTRKNRKSIPGLLFRFGAITLAAMGLAMPVLWPALKSVQGGKLSQAGAETAGVIPEGAYQFTLWEFLQKLLPGQYDGFDNDALPSVFCGSLMLLLALLFFVQREHLKREKAAWLCMLALPAAGFLWRPVDYALHIFQYPHCFPYRYAFLWSAVILILAWKAYQQLSQKTQLVRILTALGGLYLCAELFFNGVILVSEIHRNNIYTARNIYDMRVTYTQPLMEEIDADQGFFRVETDLVDQAEYGDRNTALMYGQRGMTSFVSIYNRKVNEFLGSLGAERKGFINTGRELTPFADSLFGVKYRVTLDPECFGYTLKQTAEAQTQAFTGTMRAYLHENTHALSLGYPVPYGDKLLSWEPEKNPFENQNLLLYVLGAGEREIFRQIPFALEEQGDSVLVRFTVPADCPVWFYVKGEETTPKAYKLGAVMQIVREGTEGAVTESSRRVLGGTNLFLGCFSEGEQVQITVDTSELAYEDCYLARMDTEAYEEAVNHLKERELLVTYDRGGRIEGTVTAEEGEALFTTLPAGEGISVCVDGIKTEYQRGFDTFVVIPLSAGRHDITITYTAPGAAQGAAACAVTALAVMAIWGVRRRGRPAGQ